MSVYMWIHAVNQTDWRWNERNRRNAKLMSLDGLLRHKGGWWGNLKNRSGSYVSYLAKPKRTETYRNTMKWNKDQIMHKKYILNENTFEHFKLWV
jgi:hypothetical protein